MMPMNDIAALFSKPLSKIVFPKELEKPTCLYDRFLKGNHSNLPSHGGKQCGGEAEDMPNKRSLSNKKKKAKRKQRKVEEKRLENLNQQQQQQQHMTAINNNNETNDIIARKEDEDDPRLVLPERRAAKTHKWPSLLKRSSSTTTNMGAEKKSESASFDCSYDLIGSLIHTNQPGHTNFNKPDQIITNTPDQSNISKFDHSNVNKLAHSVSSPAKDCNVFQSDHTNSSGPGQPNSSKSDVTNYSNISGNPDQHAFASNKDFRHNVVSRTGAQSFDINVINNKMTNIAFLDTKSRDLSKGSVVHGSAGQAETSDKGEIVEKLDLPQPALNVSKFKIKDSKMSSFNNIDNNNHVDRVSNHSTIMNTEVPMNNLIHKNTGGNSMQHENNHGRRITRAMDRPDQSISHRRDYRREVS